MCDFQKCTTIKTEYKVIGERDTSLRNLTWFKEGVISHYFLLKKEEFFLKAFKSAGSSFIKRLKIKGKIDWNPALRKKDFFQYYF